MNRSTSQHNRSRSAQSTASVKRVSSAKQTPKKLAFFEVLVEDKLRKNRERLTHTLDTYTMLIRSNHPIRCLEHNSAVSVYCQSDNKLLCSNCIFGKSEHKYHKVAPIDRGEKQLTEQIRKMASGVKKEAKTIGAISESIVNNLQLEETEMRKTLNTLALRYQQAHELLQQCFTRSKEVMITSMKELTVKHQTVALQLNFLKDVYSSCTTQEWNLQGSSLQELLYRHSILKSITDQQKFEGNLDKKIQPTFHLLGQQQVTAVELICSQLSQQLQKSQKQ